VADHLAALVGELRKLVLDLFDDRACDDGGVRSDPRPAADVLVAQFDRLPMVAVITAAQMARLRFIPGPGASEPSKRRVLSLLRPSDAIGWRPGSSSWCVPRGLWYVSARKPGRRRFPFILIQSHGVSRTQTGKKSRKRQVCGRINPKSPIGRLRRASMRWPSETSGSSPDSPSSNNTPATTAPAPFAADDRRRCVHRRTVVEGREPCAKDHCGRAGLHGFAARRLRRCQRAVRCHRSPALQPGPPLPRRPGRAPAAAAPVPVPLATPCRSAS